jgi:SAM-dependent methyltransferase
MPDGTRGGLRLGERGISEALRAFVRELPLERTSILDFVEHVASSTAPGAHVLDLGAGDAPYRELFGHTDYRTADWTGSPHTGAGEADIVADAASLPLEQESVDLVLSTQVLEHVPEPADVLRECHRILRPGGRVALTAPLAWEPHELPYDYYRYTAPGLTHLLTLAGFVDLFIEPRTDSFTTLAQLIRNVASSLARAPDGLDPAREQARLVLDELAGELARLAPLDVTWKLPLGYSATALRP